MDGHQDLIAMRLRGYIPTHGVYITVNSDEWLNSPQEDPMFAGHMVGIHIRPEEDLSRLDLRCLVGLKVLVDGDKGTDRAVRAVCAKAALAGAKRIKGLVRVYQTLRMDDQPESAWVFDYSKESACT